MAIEDSVRAGNPDYRLMLYGMKSMNSMASGTSPYVEKVELFLRINRIDYDANSDFKKGPKGKIPWIMQGDVMLGDSTFIIEYLKNTYKNQVRIKQPETLQQKAIHTSVLHICENNLVYGIPYYRFLDPKGYAVMKKFLQGIMPIPFRWFVPGMVRRQVRKGLHDQGLSRHSENDIQFIFKSSLSALSTFLGDQPYFMGDQPCETDCIVFGVLDSWLYDDSGTAMAGLVREFPNLVRLIDDLRASYFPPENPSKFK